MYSKETLKKIADVLKLDASVFETNLKSEKEETLEVPVLLTEEEKNNFGTNRFNEGKRAATEILVKDLKAKHALEFEGKSVDTLIEKLAEKAIADAKIEPSEKVKKFENENKELKIKLQDALSKEQTLTKEFQDRMFHVEIRNQVLTQIPQNTVIPAEDLVELFMNRHRVAKEDSGTIIYKGDTKLVDKVLNPIPLKDAVLQFAEGYIKRNGMGGGDSGGGAVGKFKSLSEFEAYCLKNNIDRLGKEGQDLLKKNKEANFDYDK